MSEKLDKGKPDPNQSSFLKAQAAWDSDEEEHDDHSDTLEKVQQIPRVIEYHEPATVTSPVVPETIPVTLENDYITYEFKVNDYAFLDFACVFLLNEKDSFSIKPKVQSKFKIKCGNKEKDVIFIGEPVYFTKLQVYQLIFLYDPESEE